MWRLIPATVAVLAAALGMSTGAGGAGSGETVRAGAGDCAIWLAPDARFAGEFAKIDDYVDRRMRAARTASPKMRSPTRAPHGRRHHTGT